MKSVFFKSLLLSLLLVTNACNSSNNDNVEDEIQDTLTGTYVADHGQLRIEGTTIVDKNGDTVQLRGMSLFWSQWIGKYYTPETIQWLKDDWQINVIRAAMAIDEGGDSYIANPEREKEKVFRVIDAAIASGIYVIVDWHSHHAEDYITEAKAFFDEVSTIYGNTPNIIYETYNEPLDVSWVNTLKPYHESIIESIRTNDPDNIIICGTRTWSQRVDEVIGNEIEDNNVAYTLHYYAATHKQELRDITQQAINAGIPIFVTEFGVTQATGDESINASEAVTWWNFLDANKISWCNWSIADKEELAAALKPGASVLGNWELDELTQSGTMVREEIKSKNPKYD